MNKFINIIIIIIISLFLIAGCSSKSNSNKINEPSGELNEQNFDYWKELNYSERRGKQLFDKYCVICHGKYGEGDGFNSYNLDPKPQNLQDSLYISKVSDNFLNQVISTGGRGVNKSQLMPYYKYTLSEREINYIISYIRRLNSIPK